jgi:hypothetical protein
VSVDEGVDGGWVGRFGVPGTAVGVILARDHSVVLARVSVSSVSGKYRLDVSLTLSDDI